MALNLFLFEVPRLSVDIDLNYIGSVDREGMEAERPALEARLQAIFETDDFTVRRMPEEHAGGKWQLRYQGAQGQGGNLEVDLNFLHRIPIEPVGIMDSQPLGSFQVKGIPVLDLHDLAAGKLIALLDRSAARDVFDAAGLFQHPALDMERLRLPFVVMGAMSRNMDLRTMTPEAARVTATDFERMVRPLPPPERPPVGPGGNAGDRTHRPVTVASPAFPWRPLSLKPFGSEARSSSGNAGHRSGRPGTHLGHATVALESPKVTQPSRIERLKDQPGVAVKPLAFSEHRFHSP